MTVKTGSAWAGTFVTEDATGALATPSVGPVGVLYVDGVANAASVTISGSNPYKFSVTLPSLTAGQRVDMYITATISTIATASVVASEQADTLLVSDVVGADSDTLETLSDQIDDVALESTLDAIKGVGWTTETLKEIYDSIGLLATAGDIADAIWDEILAGHVLPGSTGEALADVGSSVSLILNMLSTSPSVLQTRCKNNTALTCRRASEFFAGFIYLGDMNGLTKLYFTVKPTVDRNSTPDNKSTIQIEVAGGLLYINGSVAGMPANGSITITDINAGHLSIWLSATETAKLTPNKKYTYDIKRDNEVVAEGEFYVMSAITLATV